MWRLENPVGNDVSKTENSRDGSEIRSFIFEKPGDNKAAATIAVADAIKV